ncbi:hypothetical protein CEE45_12960 [Candidatus Heimdallarchaeota archaeon B3_Heim]|nr:MAG: hypothetical protein CEE45_12960 [Candidatus Heimdallarchaeota archaeon B3_Heim]
MAENNKMAYYVGTFIFVIIGYFVSLFVEDLLAEVAPSESILEIFTPFRVMWIFTALVWFIFLFVVYWGSTMFTDFGERTGLASITFVITLIIATLAMVIAYIIFNLVNDSSVTIDLDYLLDSYFIVLRSSVAPAVAATFGYSNKSK